jgi:hypothetical protein
VPKRKASVGGGGGGGGGGETIWPLTGAGATACGETFAVRQTAARKGGRGGTQVFTWAAAWLGSDVQAPYLQCGLQESRAA